MPTNSKEKNFKSGFVSLIGRPNVGKSTLTNALVGENLSIITPKAQTTRQRIKAFWTTKSHQIVLSDTPGILKPAYKLHEAMLEYVHASLEDADLVLFLVDGEEEEWFKEEWKEILAKIQAPTFLIINKVDILRDKQKELAEYWQGVLSFNQTFFVSAAKGSGLEELKSAILEIMPVHPPYYDPKDLSDRTERFYTAEFIREAIFLLYHQEVPYSCEVVVQSFKEEGKLLRIQAEIYVERTTQRSILIGKNGEAIRELGTKARMRIEEFFGKKVFLELYVRVEADWRNKPLKMRIFGYE